MRKRIISSLLSLVLLISTVTAMAVPVSAAPNMQTSWNGVAMIKSFEGFSKYPYWDNGQYTVGYGTRCPDADYSRYAANGITEAEAEKLFRTHLTKVESAVNWFANKYNLTFSQTKFDALVDFTYNCGSGWMNGNYKFRTAVLNGTTGKAFVETIASWCTASGTVYSNLLTRRLCEANLYLNGIYGSTAKYFYSHVLYNAHGGSLSTTGYQIFPAGTTADFRLTATRSGYEFQGWYTSSSNGVKVTKLDSTLDGKTLHAYWNTAGSGTTTKPQQNVTEVNYQCTVSVSNYLNVRKNPGSSSEAVGILANGTVVTIVAETTADGAAWGKLSNGGWISLKYTKKNGTDSGTDTKTNVTVKTAVNIRSGAGTNYSMSGSLAPGKTVAITKISTDNQGRPWGKLSSGGWICLTYTDYVVHTVVDDNVTVKVTSGPLNVRSGAGTSYPTQKTLSTGTSVTIVSCKTVSGMVWGKLSGGGWISLAYTDYSTSGTPTTGGNTGTSGSGTMATISTSGGLNVRSSASTGASIVGSYPYGTQVKILEQKTVSGVVWGRTVDGWINMSYVKTNGGTSTGKSYTITGDSVNVRNGAGTSYAIINVLNKGSGVVIVNTKTNTDGMTWGQLSSGGWISMNYVA